MNNDYEKIFEKSNNEKIFGFKTKGENQSIKFYLPNLLFENSENVNVFRRLKSYIQLLIKYKQYKIEKENKENIQKNNLEKYDINDNFSQELNNLLSYLLLIEDHENNPEFLIFKKINSKNSKNIDWKKTIDKNDLFFINKKPIYNTFFSKSKVKDMEHEFYKLYQDSLNNAFELFLGYKIFKDINKRVYSTEYKEEKSIINNFLHNSFKDRDIQIAKLLKDIYNSKSESNSSNKKSLFLDNTEEINMVWEHMVNTIIKMNKIEEDTIEYTKKVGEFRLTKAGKKAGLRVNKRGLAIEIDHIKIDEDTKKIFILDSKFYSTYNNMKKICTHCSIKKTCNQCLQDILQDFNSPSINKQETYKRIIQKKEEYKDFNIKNFFVMPKTDKSYSSPIHFADHVLISNIEDDTNTKNEDYLIHCIALDFNEVVNLYLENKEYTSFLDLLKEIN